MLGDGLLIVDDFVTMTPRDEFVNPVKALKTGKDVREYFAGHDSSKVIVMQNQWKSHIRREPIDFLRPLPFYGDAARRLINEQPGWEGQAFLAVQWRTKTSTGNLTLCYSHVRDAWRNTARGRGWSGRRFTSRADLAANASDTYSSEQAATREKVLRMIEEDYPAATNNSVSIFLEQLEDLGVRSIASGVLVSTKRSWAMHRGVCQKIHSKFMDLVTEWREVYGLFPAFYRMGSTSRC